MSWENHLQGTVIASKTVVGLDCPVPMVGKKRQLRKHTKTSDNRLEHIETCMRNTRMDRQNTIAITVSSTSGQMASVESPREGCGVPPRA